jgi:hypothetical protein
MACLLLLPLSVMAAEPDWSDYGRLLGKHVRSQIFDWFRQDFAVVGGVEAFIRRNQQGLPEKLPLKLKANIPYDWSLNAS